MNHGEAKKGKLHYSKIVEDELYNIPVPRIFMCISTAAFLKRRFQLLPLLPKQFSTQKWKCTTGT